MLRTTRCGFMLAALLLSVIHCYAVAAETESKEIPLADVQRFSTAISHIKNYYVNPIQNKKLFDNAIQGMLVGLDPHSAFLDVDAFKELQASTRGEFGGLGIEVTMEKGVIRVIAPIDDTPAKKAGIRAGDYIIKLGKKSVQGMTLSDAVKIMRGKPGSGLELLILRKGEKKPLKKMVVRDVIEVQSVKSKLYDHQYGYVRLSHFQAHTAENMISQIKSLQQQAGGHIKGLVLDLRNNPGGLLDAAIETSDAFINSHRSKSGKAPLIVYTEGRLPNSKFVAKATPGDVLHNAPIVVLINGGSASGSEIVAGALKDNKRAILMGTKSFGKGSVQTILPIDNHTAIKLTTALYYTPAGISIQAKGITPDIVVNSVTIPEDKTQHEDLLDLSESSLSGHLRNGNGSSATSSSGKPAATLETSTQLIHNDYQLHEAMTLLKGLTMRARHPSQST